jgi:NADPH2:quinone reductase
MSKAFVLHQTGGPDVLSFETVPLAAPGPGQVHLRQTAVGLNFIDVYHRTGLYPLPLPSGIGMEAVGIVDELGADVSDLVIGQRVAYAGGPVGAYAEARIMAAASLVPVPDAVSDQQAASLMLQGMTVQYLLTRTFPVKAGDVILLHAAAGGIGLLACQWAKSLGATIIGTVSSEAKAALAKSHGADYVIDYSKEDFVARVREITSGKGVAVVYDSVGKDTFLKSLDCLQQRGLLVSFGQSSGAVEPFNPGLLSAKGSLFLTRPTLAHYTGTRADLLATAKDVFTQVEKGTIKATIGQTYPLAEAAQAHRDLEARKTSGSVVFTV